MSVWAVLVAAGNSTRMGQKTNKVLASLAGEPALPRCVRVFSGEVDGIVAVVRDVDLPVIESYSLDVRIAVGGRTRQQSVLNGLRALPEDAEIVLVHDAARPFVTPETIRRCIASVRQHGSGVAGVPVKDTIKQVSPDGDILGSPPRETLWSAQTPQAFAPRALYEALCALEQKGVTVTDDAAAMAMAGHTVRMVQGDYTNIKLTTPEDMMMAQTLSGGMPQIRVGHGYDVHRLVEGRPLILCGITVPYEKGLLGHSDADVALHALTDALLGAAALGDIGRHFPDTDPQYKGASSAALLTKVAALLGASGFAVGNVDVTIAAQQPKLASYLPEMKRMVAQLLAISTDAVNIKATTTEGLGFEGEGKGISAHAVALLCTSR